jgi:hypothetical protein
MHYKKGDTVERLTTCAVIPLFVEQDETVYSRLPRYAPLRSDPNGTTTPRLSSLPKPTQEYVRSILQEGKEEPILIYSIVASVYILFLDDEKYDGLLDHILASVRDDNDDDDDDAAWTDSNSYSKAQIIRSYKVMRDKIDRERWERLITAVSKRLHIVWTEHPLHSYASQQVPTLTKEEREEVMQALELSERSISQSTLFVMKKIQDSCSARPYGVFLDPDQSFKYPHSCLPTAQLELLLPTGQLALTSRYDLTSDSPVTISYIEEDESVERREDRVQRRTGQSCGCLRCLYEANPQHQLSALDSKQAMQLGHFYMASGLFDKAQPLYEYGAKKESNDPDLWHAQGALELSLGRFLRAQRIWKQAAAQSTACQQHAGMVLQSTKLEAYGYLRPLTTPGSIPPDLTWQSPVHDAFATRMLDWTTCQQVIEWAESGEWTQQRHYAVPTHDVPVHTVPPLLAWFNDWIWRQVCPLLAEQFRTTANYYVHDAFCVRYRAGEPSNHLPVHTDESTHSFVLALNDDYQGGGTYFYDQDTTIRLQTGEMLSFRGDRLEHGGEALAQGTRYIMAVFLYHDDDSDDNDGRDQRGPKRPSSEITHLFQESKQQKTGFTFNFATT